MEGNIRDCGELTVGERKIIVYGQFGHVLDTDVQERGGSAAWGMHVEYSGREFGWIQQGFLRP